jgi:hypothetical protein
MYETKTFEFILRADEPIAHHEGSIGNTSLCMRRKQRQPDGTFTDVPIVTGDTMRHKLREASAFAVLDAADLLTSEVLTEPALRLLFAGGQITGASGGSVKLDAYRELVELVPPLALFGGCAQNRCIPGRLWINDAVLICEETMWKLPPKVVSWLENTHVDTARRHVEEVQRVRMDPSLDPAKRKLLTGGDQVEANRRLVARENASSEEDDAGKLAEKSTMLPRTFECIVSGSLFYWKTSATLLSELDLDTYQATVMMFLANAYVGGKRATGHGKLSVVKAWQMSATRPRDIAEDVQADALAPRVGGILRAHVQERKDRVKQFLETVLA